METLGTTRGVPEQNRRRAVIEKARAKGKKAANKKRQPSSKVSSAKACEILEHGEVHGKKLTPAQRQMFGAACGRGRK